MGNRYGSEAEQILRHFHAWEMRGRGWKVFPDPVELEPPFRPFEKHYIWTDADGRDTGRRPSFLSSLFGTTPASLGDSVEAAPTLAQLDALVEHPAPYPVSLSQQYAELHVLLPFGYEPPRALSEQLIESLNLCASPIAFELVGCAAGVSLQFACEENDELHVRQALSALMPEASIRRRDFHLYGVWEEGRDGLVVEFGLASEFMRPIRPLTSFGVDPLAAVVAAMVELEETEAAVLQVVFEPARAAWAESMNRAILGNDGSPFPFFPADLPALTRTKTRRPLFAVVLRLGVRAHDRSRTLQIAKQLTSTLSQFSDPTSNELVPLSNDPYEYGEDHERAFLNRVSHRPGMILNLDELTGLVHLPWAAVRHPRFQRASTRTRRAPALALGHSLRLGVNEHDGDEVPITLSAEQRMRHTYIVGASGSGKSVLLLNMIIQDIAAGRGVAVIDPHGDLVDDVMSRVPEARHKDVVVLDPADEAFPVGLNILAAHSELERTLLSSDLVAIFRRFSTSWGDQMSTVLGNAILAFLESPEGGTLLDLKRFLGDAAARAAYLRKVTDPDVVYYWKKEFPLLKGNAQASILTRLDTFLRPKLTRRMFGQKKSLDFRALMDDRRILLVKLSHGAIGEENASLLGALIVAKLNQAALSRQELASASRADFYLYIDEFHHAVTPSIAALLSGVRKYRLALTLAHQDLTQLSTRDSEVAAAVENAYTRIVFRVSDHDARKLADGFSSFEARDLQSLGIGQAVARIERAVFDFNLATDPPPASVPPDVAEQVRKTILDHSRSYYATPRDEVDQFLVSLYASDTAAVEPPASPRPAAPTPPPASDAPASGPEPARVVAEQPPAAGKSIRPTSPRPTTPGRGGSEHKYLQTLIKQLGEDRGYRATIERQVEGGSIDVALENDQLRIACEVSVTTGAAYEVGSLRNRLAAGFHVAVVVAPDKRVRDRLVRAVEEELPASDQERVRILTPDDLPTFLTELEARAAGREQRVGGYKVTTNYKPVNADESTAREGALGKVIRDSLKRLRGKEPG